MHQSAIVLVRCVPGSSPTAAILKSEKTLGTRLVWRYVCMYERLLWDIPDIFRARVVDGSQFQENNSLESTSNFQN